MQMITYLIYIRRLGLAIYAKVCLQVLLLGMAHMDQDLVSSVLTGPVLVC